MKQKPQSQDNKPCWGLLPEQIRSRIRRREWDNFPSLKARLLGTKGFPIRIGLKPPDGSSAILNMDHFQKFVQEWKSFHHQDLVQWSVKNYRDLSEQDIPIFVVIGSIQDLIRFLGDKALSRSRLWECNMLPVLQLDQNLYPALVKHLDMVENLSSRDAELLAQLLPQLKPSLGTGLYLRALPLVGVDTKFLEKYLVLIEELTDTIHKGKVFESNGFLKWLDCIPHPKGFAQGVPIVRPLCLTSREQLGGFPMMQIPSDILRENELPALNIIVVENVESGLALPEMDNTVAVIGGGKNVAWMDASWLKNKRVGYWGDIDTWGFSILSDVRSKLAEVEPLMMDIETIKMHEGRMVPEPEHVGSVPVLLTNDEANLFNDLISDHFLSSRLEQERLSSDYICDKLKKWLSLYNS